MRGRSVLLLSLLCVAQAFPLTLNESPNDTHLERNKRYVEHSNIADTEVRTIISAIVDAILDGDKKKRSEIPEDDVDDIDKDITNESESEEATGNYVSVAASAPVSNYKRTNLVIDSADTGEKVRQDNDNDNGDELGESGSESGSGGSSGEPGDVESGSESIIKRNFISNEEQDEDTQSGSGNDTSSGSGFDTEVDMEDTKSNENIELPAAMEIYEKNREKDSIPYVENSRTKRNEEAQDHFKRSKVTKSKKVTNRRNTTSDEFINVIHPPVRDSQRDNLYYNLKGDIESADIDFNSANFDMKSLRPESPKSSKPKVTVEEQASGSGNPDSLITFTGSGTAVEFTPSQLRNIEQQISGSGSLDTESHSVPPDSSESLVQPFAINQNYFPETEDDDMYSNSIVKRDNIANEDGDEDNMEDKKETKRANPSTKSQKIKNIDVVYVNYTAPGPGITVQNIHNTTDSDAEGSAFENSATGESSSGFDEVSSASGIDPDEQIIPQQLQQKESPNDVVAELQEFESSGEKEIQEEEESGSGILNSSPENVNVGKNYQSAHREMTKSNKEQLKSLDKKLTTKVENKVKDNSEESKGETDSKDYQADSTDSDGDENSGDLDDPNDDKEDAATKKEVIHQIVRDMAKAAMDSVTEEDSDDQDDGNDNEIVKKSAILESDLLNRFEGSDEDDLVETSGSGDELNAINGKATEEPIYQGDFQLSNQNQNLSQREKDTQSYPTMGQTQPTVGQAQPSVSQVQQLTTEEQPVTTNQPSTQGQPFVTQTQLQAVKLKPQLSVKNKSYSMAHAYEIDKALKSLIKSILDEDPEIKLKMREIEDKREETEEKLQRDILDVMPISNDQSESDSKDKVFTEVKDFEGFVDALSQEPSLDPWKHDVIVRKLEKDLLNHLRIPESDEELFIKQEDELMQISEMEYIKDKINEIEENTSEFAQRHSENLESVKEFAIASLTPIIEALPLKKRDLNELANKISKSAWLRMVTNSRRKAHVRKIKNGFRRLMLFD